ncbi:MAG: hypothetical protein RI964_487 [Pseudomonadota bacterium]|jgi:Spy/CpxP family protein refolding chaperone
MKKVLLTSALVGILSVSIAAFADHGGGCGGPDGRPGAGEHMGDMLKDKLKLDDAQKTKLDDIMKDQRTKMEALRTQMQEQMKALRTESDGKIAAILTPEQATTFKQMQDERQKRQDERREEMKKRLDSGNF